MKKLILTSLLALLWNITILHAQCNLTWGTINFEDSYTTAFVEIDSNSIWQIGPPNKTLFTTAFSAPNTIVTDTLNPYPINDTSSFILKQIVSGQLDWVMQNWGAYIAGVDGYYFINSDTLTDYLQIEFSPDNGLRWFNLTKDSILSDTIQQHYWTWENNNNDLALSGSSSGWQYFHFTTHQLMLTFDVHECDTVLYRFTFISDSIQSNKDGLMFDNLNLIDYAESITNLPANLFQSQAYPNPAKSQIIIDFDNDDYQDFELEVFNALGLLIYSEKNIRGNRIELNLSDFPQGAYYYNLRQTESGKWSKGKFVRTE